MDAMLVQSDGEKSVVVKIKRSSKRGQEWAAQSGQGAIWNQDGKLVV